jgi:thioredoxin reductase
MIDSDACDVAIIGAGPAGMAAAIAARSFGLDVCLVDEQARFGGQIYRQPPAGFHVDSWLAGGSYASGRALVERAERMTDVRHIGRATVLGLFPAQPQDAGDPRHHVLFHDNVRLGRISARQVLVATGAYEMPVPFPGWQTPGVMSAGGIQTLLKSQRVAAGGNIALAGSHPLLLVVAEQLLAADLKVAAIAFAQPASQALRLIRHPRALLPGASQLRRTLSTLVRLRRARVPILFEHVVTEALGSDRLEAVRLRRSSGRGRESIVICDALGVCYGFLASSELARQAGARNSWVNGSGWVVQADEFMRASVAGMYVAGEQTGIAGAEAAALSGEIAAVGMALDAGRVSKQDADARTAALRIRLARVRRFAILLAELSAPPSQLLTDIARRPTLLCRCEDVSVAQLTDALSVNPGVMSASTAKLLTRVGMGFCQGRMCEVSVRRVIAQVRGCPIEGIPGFVVRPPVKPIPLALLAADPGAIDIDPAALQ